jgi:hypothetical protein
VLDNGTGPLYCPINGSDSKYISETTTYTVTVTGPGGTATANVMVTFDSSTTPTVSIAASPATINPGESSTLTWQSYFATTASIDNNIGIVPVNGNKTVSPVKTTTYKITVSDSVSTASATATVIVVGTGPTVSISASPATIVNGGSSTLTWTTTNAATTSIDNGIGVVPVNGSVSVSPTATTTYTIMATGAGGSASLSVKVTVEAAPPTITFGATPEYIAPNGSSTLTWTTKDATSVYIDQGIGAVDLSGSKAVTPTNETTYILTATGPGGTAIAIVAVKMLDAYLQTTIWGGMKVAMLAGNVNQVAAQFSDQTRDKYSQIFTAIVNQLPQIALEMREIEPVYFEEYGAKFRIKRTEEIEGVIYDITYYIYFVQEEDGSWKILNY